MVSVPCRTTNPSKSPARAAMSPAIRSQSAGRALAESSSGECSWMTSSGTSGSCSSGRAAIA